MKKTIFLAGLIALSLGAQAGPNQPVIDNVARNVIMQTYVDLAGACANLSSAVVALSEQPTQDNLNRAQQAWLAARVPWEASEAFLFGPVESLGIDGMIDTWPLNKLDLDGVLSSGNALTPDFVRHLGENLQGFHTLEYLLFGDGVASNRKDIGQMTSRQIEYLRSVAAIQASLTARLADAWTRNANPDNPALPGFVEIISKPGRDNPSYQTERAVLIELVTGMIKIIEEVSSSKLANPLGGDIASAKVSLVESPFSWNSLVDFKNNLQSVLNVYTGRLGAHAGPGIKDIVARSNPALANQVEARIQQSMQKIMDIGGPAHYDYRQAIVDPAGRERAKAAMADLRQLRDLIQGQVMPLVKK